MSLKAKNIFKAACIVIVCAFIIPVCLAVGYAIVSFVDGLFR